MTNPVVKCTSLKWYYEKKELRSPPSVQKGLPLDTEQRYRREGIRFIRELGSAMNLSPTTMATASVYYHRFYMFHTFQDFPRYPTACACLFLAGKAEETPKKCRDVIKFAKDLLPDPKFSQFGPEPRNYPEEVMTLERILLQTIKFDLDVEHPYTFLVKYGNCLKGDKQRRQKMVQMAWTFVNDSLCTTLCLQWEPEIIAIALMYLAGKLSKFDVVDWEGRKSEHLRWWDLYVSDMSIDILEDICHQVLDMYSHSQPTPPDSPQQGGGAQQQNKPPNNIHSTNVSPMANFVSPQGNSKTSTPVDPILASSSGVPPPYLPVQPPPPPFVIANFSQPPPPPPTATVPIPPGYAPPQGHGFFSTVPPPPLSRTNSHQPPLPPPN